MSKRNEHKQNTTERRDIDLTKPLTLTATYLYVLRQLCPFNLLL